MRPFKQRLRGGILTRKPGVVGWPPCGGWRLWLLSSTAIALAGAVTLSQPIFAAEECGTGSSVVCDSADPDYSTFFADGITYDPVADLTLIVASDVAIAPNSGVKGIFINSTGGIIDLTLEDGASITTASAFAAIDIRKPMP